MQKEYMLGFGVGTVLVILVLAVFSLRKKPWKGTYDERQMLARGRAFALAFWVLVAYLALYAWSSAILGPWCDAATGAFLGIVLSIGVFGVYCVCNDAYFYVTQSPGMALIGTGLIALVNLFVGVDRAARDGFVTDGKLNAAPSLNLSCALALLVVIAAAVVKRAADRKREREDEES